VFLGYEIWKQSRNIPVGRRIIGVCCDPAELSRRTSGCRFSERSPVNWGSFGFDNTIFFFHNTSC
jgi:hypothetical protein